MKEVTSGVIKLRAHDLPAFLYPPADFDKHDPDYNLCRSEIVIQVLMSLSCRQVY